MREPNTIRPPNILRENAKGETIGSPFFSGEIVKGGVWRRSPGPSGAGAAGGAAAGGPGAGGGSDRAEPAEKGRKGRFSALSPYAKQAKPRQSARIRHRSRSIGAC